jgi:predicted Ser/Thr protein kinase
MSDLIIRGSAAASIPPGDAIRNANHKPWADLPGRDVSARDLFDAAYQAAVKAGSRLSPTAWLDSMQSQASTVGAKEENRARITRFGFWQNSDIDVWKDGDGWIDANGNALSRDEQERAEKAAREAAKEARDTSASTTQDDVPDARESSSAPADVSKITRGGLFQRSVDVERKGGQWVESRSGKPLPDHEVKEAEEKLKTQPAQASQAGQVIGKGGTASVTDNGDGTATKTFRKEGFGSPDREAKALAELNSLGVECVPKLVSHEPGSNSIRMQKIDGVTLDRFLKTASPDQIAKVQVAVDKAFNDLKRVGKTSIDYKTDNIMVTPGGKIYIIDWSLGRDDRNGQNIEAGRGKIQQEIDAALIKRGGRGQGFAAPAANPRDASGRAVPDANAQEQPQSNEARDKFHRQIDNMTGLSSEQKKAFKKEYDDTVGR